MELKQVIASAVQWMGLLDFINHPKELISESYYMYKPRKIAVNNIIFLALKK